ERVRRWTTHGIRQVEVEVHADSLEELIVDRHEATFHRNLQVLETAQLRQQIRDFLVDRLCLTDDETERRLKRFDVALTAHFAPGRRLDRRNDQIDQGVEVSSADIRLCAGLSSAETPIEGIGRSRPEDTVLDLRERLSGRARQSARG